MEHPLSSRRDKTFVSDHGSSPWLGPGPGSRLYLCVALAVAAASTAGGGEDAGAATALPRVTWVSIPPVVVPGQSLGLRLQWPLPPAAEPGRQPGSALSAAWLTWSPARRTADDVFWDGDLVPVRPGPVQGTLTCTAAVPDLPADLPRITGLPIPPRFLVNLYSPCRWALRTVRVQLPVLEVSPMPALPSGTPPFVGLLGDWEAALSSSPEHPRLLAPFHVELTLRGNGSSALLRAPPLTHPDLALGEPALTRDAADGTIRLRWTATAARVPMTPLRVELSTFDGRRYVPHRLALHLDARPDPATAPGQAALPPFLTTFRPLPPSPPKTIGVGLTRGVGAALAGGLAGLTLALLARRRDIRRTPAGRRRAALSRLRRARIAQVNQMPTVYRDLRTYFGLPPGASAAQIVAATQVRWPELAAELEGLERRRFDPSASAAVNTNRLAALLRRLATLVVLALTAMAGAVPTTDSALLASAELAFQRQDYREACLALMQLRRRAGDSPELLMNLGNALWFTGRPVEALALYERALRLEPRHADLRRATAWLRRVVLADAPGTASPYPRPWRDGLRPDEWLFVAGLLAGLGALGAGFCRWRRHPAAPVLTGAGLVAALCLLLAVGQHLGPYRREATARLTEPVTLRAAPATAADTVGPALPKGALVIPREHYAGWVRVRSGAVEGWAPEPRCVSVW